MTTAATDCPACGSDTKVLDTRHSSTFNALRRRRECIKCGTRMTTIELSEEQLAARVEMQELIALRGLVARLRAVLNESEV